ncbi:hypothetical protein VP01_342g1 [Puccinia sorghi]|uniref:Uncharacterized protein n=1 Tax=Puccinia sorghi TaxID=27349 RepID=A0A0L6UWF4_9BASI|nr:hypothetical protein VP01_342g1 [Puccinia sorghi]
MQELHTKHRGISPPQWYHGLPPTMQEMKQPNFSSLLPTTPEQFQKQAIKDFNPISSAWVSLSFLSFYFLSVLFFFLKIPQNKSWKWRKKLLVDSIEHRFEGVGRSESHLARKLGQTCCRMSLTGNSSRVLSSDNLKIALTPHCSFNWEEKSDSPWNVVVLLGPTQFICLTRNLKSLRDGCRQKILTRTCLEDNACTSNLEYLSTSLAIKTQSLRSILEEPCFKSGTEKVNLNQLRCKLLWFSEVLKFSFGRLMMMKQVKIDAYIPAELLVDFHEENYLNTINCIFIIVVIEKFFFLRLICKKTTLCCSINSEVISWQKALELTDFFPGTNEHHLELALKWEKLKTYRCELALGAYQSKPKILVGTEQKEGRTHFFSSERRWSLLIVQRDVAHRHNTESTEGCYVHKSGIKGFLKILKYGAQVN